METVSENSNFIPKIGQNDHSNPYIESTTVLSDMCTLRYRAYVRAIAVEDILKNKTITKAIYVGIA